MSPPLVDVVHVGSASRDIAPEDPRGWRLGGGCTYAALTTARLGLRTAAVIGVDAVARRAHELEALREAGVDLIVVDLPESPVFHNVETAAGRVQTAIARGVPLRPMPLPESWLAAASWSLVPVADEVGDDWADLIPDGTIVAVGWQGMLRRLAPSEQVTRLAPTPRVILRRADLVGVSHHDVHPATRLDALMAFLGPGARLLITQGDRGGLLVTTSDDGPVDVLRYLPTRSDEERDPTGAGDIFLAALLAAAVRPDLLRPSSARVGADLRFAAAAGSLAVEGIGLAGVPDLGAVRMRRARERVRRAVRRSAEIQVGAVDAGALDAAAGGTATNDRSDAASG